MQTFDDVALVYDDAIDWEARLAREMPFILATIGDTAGKTVLDIACGTGRHSIELASQEATVTGIDISASMLERARQLAKERSLSVQFTQLDMSRLDDLAGSRFDLVLCLGNSLALSENHEALERMLMNVHSLLSEEGAFVAQVLNFDEILRTEFKYFPLKVGETADGATAVFFRFFEHSPADRTSDLVILTFVQRGGEWYRFSSVQPVLNLNRSLLESALRRAGFSKVEVFGDYGEGLFSEDTSRNLIVRAYK